MHNWPAGHYRQHRATAARDPGAPGPGSYALRRGAPRHAAGTREMWYGTIGPDDLAHSPPGGSPEPPEYHHDDPGMPAPGLWYPPDENAPEHPLPRRAPASRNKYRRLPSPNRYPRRGFPRWLPVAVAGIIVIVVAVALITTHQGTTGTQLTGQGTTSSAGHGNAAAGTALQPVITTAAARQVLARYTSVNNQANKLRDNALLAAIEGGTSYLMDTGTYRFDRATDPQNSHYVALGLQDAAYYIPRQQAGDWPHFFAVKVAYADLASPQHVTGTGYLLFEQAAPGGPWKDVIEPYVIPAVRPAPAIATSAQGYAQPVSMTGSASRLSASPAQIQPDTIRWLDTEAAAGADPANAGSLADLRDVIFWRSRLPSGTVTDKHVGGPGPAFGLRTADGGAIFFYSLTARLHLAPPPGDTFRVQIPGYYSSGQELQSATVGYIEQFAAYDPPRGKGGPRVVADASSIAERG